MSDPLYPDGDLIYEHDSENCRKSVYEFLNKPEVEKVTNVHESAMDEIKKAKMEGVDITITPNFIKHKETFSSLFGVIHNYYHYRNFQNFRNTQGIGYFLKREDPEHDDMIILIFVMKAHRMSLLFTSK